MTESRRCHQCGGDAYWFVMLQHVSTADARIDVGAQFERTFCQRCWMTTSNICGILATRIVYVGFA